MNGHSNGANGVTAAEPQVITWDYQFAPNAQKARNLLNAAKIPFRICEQPFVLPRPILGDLGITYRRVPVNSIGKDFYCDNRVFLDSVQHIFKDKALPTTTHDHAYEAFGYRSFWISLPTVRPSLLTPELQKDRAELFSVFTRSDFGELRQNSLAEMRTLLDMVETEFLANSQWIAGDRCGVADIHAMWIIKWALQTLDVGQEPGFSKQDFPKVYRWVEGLPAHVPENEPEKLSKEVASTEVLAMPYGAPDIGIDPSDPLGMEKGAPVTVGTNDDAKPHNNPQHGKLVGLSKREIVIELDNSIRVHFPRIGYVVKRA